MENKELVKRLLTFNLDNDFSDDEKREKFADDIRNFVNGGSNEAKGFMKAMLKSFYKNNTVVGKNPKQEEQPQPAPAEEPAPAPVEEQPPQEEAPTEEQPTTETPPTEEAAPEDTPLFSDEELNASEEGIMDFAKRNKPQPQEQQPVNASFDFSNFYYEGR